MAPNSSRSWWWSCARRRERRPPHKCVQIQTTPEEQAAVAPTTINPTTKFRQLQKSSTTMASCCCCISNKKPGPIIASFVSFLLFLLVSFSALATASATKHGSGGGNGTTQVAFHSGEELVRFQRIEAQLARIRKASVKTIQSPDGDVIDCVPSHLQPAFEHPKLRGQKPEDAPAARPRSGVSTGHGNADAVEDDEALPQAWRDSGESCPEGTIPVRRTTEGDLLRASSVGRFGMKPRGGGARRDSTGSGHEVSHGPE